MSTDPEAVTRNPKLRVLLIEDNPGDARLIEEMLKESGLEFSLDCVASLSPRSAMEKR